MNRVLLFFALYSMISISIADNPSVIIELPSQMTCKILRDPKSKVIFYLESDRHHLSAMSHDGALLWQVDTWANLPKQGLISIGRKGALINFIDLFKRQNQWASSPIGRKDETAFLEVSFNSSAFGLIKKSTGEIIIEGID